jgi:protein-S-isoprenylcysteine O-methyltransferase Ste14
MNNLASPPLLYGISFVIGLTLNWQTPATIVAAPLASSLGLVLLALGVALAVWGKRTMQHEGTPAHPALPAKALVVTGPFAFSRNPLYVARTLLYVGLAFAMNTSWPLITLLPLLAFMHYAVVLGEERQLDARFGVAYRAYRTRVRRWL